MIVKHLSEVLPEKEGDFTRWYLSRADRGHSLAVRYVEETIFYIEGKGLARVGGKEVRVKPGTMVVVPPGTVHSSIKEGLEPLRYLAIFVGNPEL
jgi:mannose-6-phosphate isomerase-like protein (cupin superfamily)